MYAGFITPKKTSRRVGIHQRLDSAAYKMIADYVPGVGAFPGIREILNFEGYNGPDGLKSKRGLKYKTVHDHEDPSHFYDPATGGGEVPQHIANHYQGLVHSLSTGDRIRASFEAAWLAHYVCDGLTPAHHWPLEEKITEVIEHVTDRVEAGDMNRLTAIIKKNWIIWGPKGHMSTHVVNFEIGIAMALLFFPIRAKFSEDEMARAHQMGAVEYFKAEARKVAALDLYNRFYKDGWTNDIASLIKNTLAPEITRTIGIIWLLAVLEASRRDTEAVQAAVGVAESGRP